MYNPLIVMLKFPVMSPLSLLCINSGLCASSLAFEALENAFEFEPHISNPTTTAIISNKDSTDATRRNVWPRQKRNAR